MVRHTEAGIAYAPLCVHAFPLVQPHLLLEAEKFQIQYADPSQLGTTADKLRWYRYRKGLRQRDVADYVGVDRSTYVHYEEQERDYYPLEELRKIAELLEVPVENLMDDYNLFLSRGQGRQLKALRKAKGLTQRQYAALVHVPLGTLKNWETEQTRMLKGTWEKLFDVSKLPKEIQARKIAFPQKIDYTKTKEQ